MSLARKGSLKRSSKTDVEHKPKSASVSSLPTPTSRSSTLSSKSGSSRLSLKGLFRPNDKAHLKTPKAVPSSLVTEQAAETSRLPVSSSLPVIPSDPQSVNSSADGVVVSPSASNPILELQRAMSPSTASLRSNHSSLLPRPNPPSRSSSVKRSRSAVPSEGGWFGQKEGSKLGQPSRPASAGSLNGMKEGIEEDAIIAERFSAIPHPQDASILPPPVINPMRNRLDSAASLDAVGRKSTHDHDDLSVMSDTLPVTPALSDAQHLDSPDDTESLDGPAWTNSVPTSSAEHSRAPSAMALFLREENGTMLRQSPTAKQPTLTRPRSFTTLKDGDEPVEIPASGIQSPLDAMVYDLGGRPISRASSVVSGSEQGAATSFLPNGRPKSLDSFTDSTSVRDMEREIRNLDYARVPLPPLNGIRKTNGIHQAPETGGKGEPGKGESSEQQNYSQQSKEVSPAAAYVDDSDELETLDVTSTSLKRWSMNEMEQSFRNMQNMLGSSRGSTFTLAAVSEDGRQTPSSSSMIIDRALVGLAADSSFEASDADSASPADSPRMTLLKTPHIDTSKPPLGSTPPMRPQKSPERQFSLSEGPTSPTLSQDSVDDEATLLPGHFPTASNRPSLLSLSTAGTTVEERDDDDAESGMISEETFGKDGSPASSRRHTLDDLPSQEQLRQRLAQDLPAERAATVTPTRSSPVLPVQRSFSNQETKASGPPRLNRMDTGATTTTADGDEEIGWATPRTSISPTSGARASLDEARLTPTMRSRVGQRWQSERERVATSTPSSSDGGSRTASGGEPTLPLRPNGVSRVPADLESSRRRTMPSRRSAFTTDDLKDSWFDDTPGRQRVRNRGALPPRMLSERDSRSNLSAEDSEHTISDIRRADKVQLFLRFSQVQAELDAVRRQSALEREALLDALNESRDVVHDLRSERNRLHTRLEKETASLRALSAALGGEDVNEDTVERLADLARSKTVWQSRAQKAASELERHREDIARLEATVENAKDRDEDRRQEIRHLELRVETLTQKLDEAQDVLRSFTPESPRALESPRGSTSQNSSPGSTRRSSPTLTKMPVRAHAKSSSADISPPRSRMANPRTGSALSTASPTSVPTASTSRLPSGIPSPRRRTVSTTSAVSSTASLEAAAAAQTSATPLNRTKMALVPPTPASPPSPARVSKIPGARSTGPTRLPSSGLPTLGKSKASPSASPVTKSGLPKLGGSTGSPGRTLPLARSIGGLSHASRESSAEPSSPGSTNIEFAEGERRRGPRSDVWPTPSVGSSNGDFKGLAEQDEQFLAELDSSQRSEAVESF